MVLGCTHYPLLLSQINRFVPKHVHIVSQGNYVAASLKDYLHRHADMAARCTKSGTCRFLTTESEAKFEESASLFVKRPIKAGHIRLG
ncbi:MAG: Glutamate racemase [Bacteroidetes bacterium ADurb.Bin416]|nr:MAG: Glutamate racemase [Bacteroidetes bacterium ADurb.Bin416]